jgi:hypothetical protein
MNNLPFFFFAGLLLFLLSCTPADIQKESSIDPDNIVRWTETTKLIWSDFQGKLPKEPKTNSEIVIQLPAKFNEAKFLASASATVECCVDKKSSWVKKTQAKPQLLLYNQILFNIYEVYARKLRKTFAETDFSVENPSAIFDSIYQTRIDELAKITARFRRESGFGTKDKKIKEWSGKIAAELKELEEFKSQ